MRIPGAGAVEIVSLWSKSDHFLSAPSGNARKPFENKRFLCFDDLGRKPYCSTAFSGSKAVICGKVVQKAFVFVMFLNGSPRLRKGFKTQYFWSRNGARLPQKSEMVPFVFLYNCEDRGRQKHRNPLKTWCFLKKRSDLEVS